MKKMWQRARIILETVTRPLGQELWVYDKPFVMSVRDARTDRELGRQLVFETNEIDPADSVPIFVPADALELLSRSTDDFREQVDIEDWKAA